MTAPTVLTLTELATAAERLGIEADQLMDLAVAWRDGDCAVAREHLVDAVATRLTGVEQSIADTLAKAAEYGPGTDAWAHTARRCVVLTEQAAHLQAVAAELHHAHAAGQCGDHCTCATALAAPAGVYRFPTNASEPGSPDLSCDLPADAGDAHDRIGEWQHVLTRVEARDPIPDAEAGLALRFPLDHDLAATLARLAAAEYRCCSFGSYSVVIDHTGLRLEVRMPAGAEGQLAAVLGTPDTTDR